MSEQLEWHRVIEAAHLGIHFLKEGEIKAIKVKRHKLCLIRQNEKLYAVQRYCPHGGAPLEQSKLYPEGVLQCPWHRFIFSCKNGQNLSGEGYALAYYPVKLEQGAMYIGFPKRKKWKLFG